MVGLDLSHCYGCGRENPRGLHLVKQIVGEQAVMELTVEKDHCGFPGILHGGITFTMVDEVMCYAILERGLVAVTSSVNIEYIRPGRLGRTIQVSGWVERIGETMIDGASSVVDLETGKCLANATGVYKIVDMKRYVS